MGKDEAPGIEPFKTISGADLMKKPRSEFDEESDLPQLLRQSEWAFKRSNLTLTHRERGYYVDLERITNSMQMLEWIAQVNEKAWASPKAIGELVRLMMHAFDQHPAPGGKSIILDIKKAIKDRPLFQKDYD